MFKKIVIANRGEIAVRIMATCREMGIATVAVYSEADSQAKHVREADEAYLIGPAPAIQSYLRTEAILEVARRSGAQAIHPGYGFLSENATFAEACEQAGIVFVGPPAGAMRVMGSKIAAKALAQSVGAPTVPGYNGESQQDDLLLEEAQRIGFPLLIKASAGSGGKGMRTVHQASEFLEQLAGARREALAAFGDGTVFLERYLQQPRHIEIQVLGDHYGHMLYLGERECSLQRRHQKILEESPSVALTPSLRRTMGEAAVRIAQAAHYTNAGTIEFLLDAEQRFYFLEMNTRLQVEHPVTELVYGLDLVRQQLLIAAGEELTITQEQVSPRGHAIEVRIYAEDPAQQFLPSTGTITRFIPPTGPGIRVDSGIDTNDQITPYYDPMLAKLIVSGEDRPAAIARLQRALTRSVVLGVTTNIPLLSSINQHPAFQSGQTTTSFLATYGFLDSPPPVTLPTEVLQAAALYQVLHNEMIVNDQNYKKYNTSGPWQILGPWRTIGEGRAFTYSFQGQHYRLTMQPIHAKMNEWRVQIEDQPAEEISGTVYNGGLLLLTRGSHQTPFSVQQRAYEMQVVHAGQLYTLQMRHPPTVETTAHSGNPAYAQKALTAPMAGTIVKVLVQDGERVEAQQVLIILSAMKMEHAVTAPQEGVVRHVHYQEGAVVPGGAVLVEME